MAGRKRIFVILIVVVLTNSWLFYVFRGWRLISMAGRKRIYVILIVVVLTNS